LLYRTKNPHGGDVYEENIILDFSSNTNPCGTPQGVLDAISRTLPELYHYPDPYCRELVRAIAAYEEIPEESILCGNGAAELIYAYCEAIRAESAVELAPTFSEYSLGLERTGCKVERYVLREENSFDPDSGFLEFLSSIRPDVVFLCNPNNPTGRLLPKEMMKQILDFCHKTKARLFLDETFLELSDDGVSMKGFLQDYPELFILKAFTKSYGMAGVRLGYCLCADAELLRRMSGCSQPWNVSLPAQAAGVAALQEQDFLKRSKEQIPAERHYLQKELETLGFSVCDSKANYLLFRGKPGLDAALKKYGIAIRNCDNYYGLCPGYYRIAVRLHGENQRLIAAIREVCGKEPS
jgi:threonine-phosphate decarboxylase